MKQEKDFIEVYLKEEDINSDSFFLYNTTNHIPISGREKQLREILDRQIKEIPEYKIYEWVKPNGSIVKKGEPILIIQEGDLKIDIRERKIIPWDEDVKIELSLPISSPSEGVLQYLIEGEQKITVGDKLFRVKKLSKEFERKPLGKIEYIFHKLHLIEEDNIENIKHGLNPDSRSIYWVVKNGQYVSSGDKIATTFIKTSQDGVRDIKAVGDGYISIIENNSIRNGKHIYSLFSTNEDKYYNKYKIETNEFTKEQSLIWEVIGGLWLSDKREITYYPVGAIELTSLRFKGRFETLPYPSFLFSINYIHNENKLVVYYTSSKIKLRESDRILFLFENQEVIKLQFDNKAIKSSVKWAEYEMTAPILDSQIKIFKESKLKKWRVEKKGGDEFVEGVISKRWYNDDELLEIFNRLIPKYFNILISEFPDYTDRELREDIEKEDTIEACSVYLMVDTTNNFHKIGVSNNPTYRERTLQSEKPTIDVLCSKEFPSRLIANSIESALHNAYAEKRIRGEWFELSGKDILEIMQTLK